MRFEQIGREVRRARIARHLTQGQLAAAAGITRTTLNQLENGSARDLGIRKVEAVLEQLELELEVRDTSSLRLPPDFVRMASTSASVSFKDKLTDRELLRALMTGKIPAGRRAHLRMLLEEAPRELLHGLIQQVHVWAPPGRLEKNLDKISHALGLDPKASKRWKAVKSTS
jgi:transcriptional regulator with XRE-family HTH domain